MILLLSSGGGENKIKNYPNIVLIYFVVKLRTKYFNITLYPSMPIYIHFKSTVKLFKTKHHQYINLHFQNKIVRSLF